LVPTIRAVSSSILGHKRLARTVSTRTATSAKITRPRKITHCNDIARTVNGQRPKIASIGDHRPKNPLGPDIGTCRIELEHEAVLHAHPANWTTAKIDGSVTNHSANENVIVGIDSHSKAPVAGGFAIALG